MLNSFVSFNKPADHPLSSSQTTRHSISYTQTNPPHLHLNQVCPSLSFSNSIWARRDDDPRQLKYLPRFISGYGFPTPVNTTFNSNNNNVQQQQQQRSTATTTTFNSNNNNVQQQQQQRSTATTTTFNGIAAPSTTDRHPSSLQSVTPTQRSTTS